MEKVKNVLMMMTLSRMGVSSSTNSVGLMVIKDYIIFNYEMTLTVLIEEKEKSYWIVSIK